MFTQSRLYAGLVGVLALGVFSATAQAQTFYVDGYGGFVTGTAVGGAEVTYINDANTETGGAFDSGADADGRNAAGVTTDVSWGTAAGALGPYGGQSGFALSRVDDQIITSDGAPVPIGSLKHFNEPIFAGTELQATGMRWTVSLFDNPADAANAEASGDANNIFSTTGVFIIENWETANAGYAAGGYRYFDGADWVPSTGTAGLDECPNQLPAGTPTTPILGPDDPAPTAIFLSDGNPDGATPNPGGDGCPDAHIYLPKSFPAAEFDYAGSTYQLQILGFYNPLGTLTDTFWACEDSDCFGEVRLSLRNLSVAPIPAVTTWALVTGIFTVLALGGMTLRHGTASS